MQVSREQVCGKRRLWQEFNKEFFLAVAALNKASQTSLQTTEFYIYHVCVFWICCIYGELTKYAHCRCVYSTLHVSLSDCDNKFPLWTIKTVISATAEFHSDVLIMSSKVVAKIL